MKQGVRIIGGHHRGKKINVPSESGLRPTPSRIRETLFNWLMHTIRGACCLDAFAGSGALGFEAWSRGASHVTCIEKSHKTFLNLKKQADAFDPSSIQVLEEDILVYLTRKPKQFDLIFLDPPFDKPKLLEQSIACLEQNKILSPNGLIYTESNYPVILNPIHWETLKTKKAGLIHYALHQKRAA